MGQNSIAASMANIQTTKNQNQNQSKSTNPSFVQEAPQPARKSDSPEPKLNFAESRRQQ
jgi:hypothetical protein